MRDIDQTGVPDGFVAVKAADGSNCSDCDVYNHDDEVCQCGAPAFKCIGAYRRDDTTVVLRRASTYSTTCPRGANDV